MDRETAEALKMREWLMRPEKKAVLEAYQAETAKQSACPRCAELEADYTRLYEAANALASATSDSDVVDALTEWQIEDRVISPRNRLRKLLEESNGS